MERLKRVNKAGVTGVGSRERPLTTGEVRSLLEKALTDLPLDGKRILTIIPDSTRSAPLPMLFGLLDELLGERVTRLDYLIALGTHKVMSEAAIDELLGADQYARVATRAGSRVFNHRWDLPETLVQIGTIAAEEVESLTSGLIRRDIPVHLNRMALEYDRLLICGPVFPHEVAGFSGGAKYLFPGISGREMIDVSHWVGALATSMETIGVKETAVRRLLHRAARFVIERVPVDSLDLVMRGDALHGVFVGDLVEAWSEAAELSALLNIRRLARPARSVLSMPARRYEDMWTAAKAVYKTEPVVEDGGEVIVYAPHLAEISYSHGELIRQVGYHVRDYFLANWERYRHLPWSILAHSTHVRGAGSYTDGQERPRIEVTLATAIPESVCRELGLGYRDPASIDPGDWSGHEDEGMLLVENAGEQLFRIGGS